MEKFNLKKAILENKATFLSSLVEGEKEYYKDAEADDAEHIDALEKDMKDDKKSNKMKMSELKAKIKEQTGQFKKGDKVNYDGEKNLIVNILKDGSPVLVPMSSIDDEAFSVDSDEISNPKLYFKVNYDGEKHLVVNILDDGSPVLVPMSVIDDEAFSIDSDEIETPMTENVTTKMKKSELKAKIKEMALAEMNINEDTFAPESEEDFLAEVDRILAEADEEVAVDDTEVSVGGEDNIDVDTTVEVDPNVKAVQDSLTQAQAAAQKLGDPKLTDQIGNTITFFTRAHVVEKGAVAEGEEMEEGYYGANTEVEDLAYALDYEGYDAFFQDNPGAVTAVLDWAAGVPEFRTKMEDGGLLEAKKEDMNESMFPMLKRILK
jgi:hypothetical protein